MFQHLIRHACVFGRVPALGLALSETPQREPPISEVPYPIWRHTHIASLAANLPNAQVDPDFPLPFSFRHHRFPRLVDLPWFPSCLIHRLFSHFQPHAPLPPTPTPLYPSPPSSPQVPSIQLARREDRCNKAVVCSAHVARAPRKVQCHKFVVSLFSPTPPWICLFVVWRACFACFGCHVFPPVFYMCTYIYIYINTFDYLLILFICPSI